MLKLLSSLYPACPGDGKHIATISGRLLSCNATIGQWPECPRCCPTGDLGIARQALVIFEDDCRLAPTYPILGIKTSVESTFLPKLQIDRSPAEKQKERVFRLDWTFKETKTMSFLVAKRHGLLRYGYARAAVLAFDTSTIASHDDNLISQVGCETSNYVGCRGDARGESYVYHNLENIRQQCYVSAPDPECETIVKPTLSLHEALRLSLDEYGSIVLPEWCHEAQRAELFLGSRQPSNTSLYQILATSSDQDPWTNQFALPLLGATLRVVSFRGCTNPCSFVAFAQWHKARWTNVAYCLVLGWCHTRMEMGETEVFLDLERFEAAGHAKVGAPRLQSKTGMDISFTLFPFDPPCALPSAARADPNLATGLDVKLGKGAASSTSGVDSAQPDLATGPASSLQDYVFSNINGTDSPLEGLGSKAVGFGSRPRFRPNDLERKLSEFLELGLQS